MSIDTSEQKVERLLKVLYELTANHSIQWDSTSDEDAFRLPSDSANVRITRKQRPNFKEDGESPVNRLLEIFNRQGKLVEEWWPHNAIDDKNFDALFTLARRSALKTDDLLDQLLHEIQNHRS